MNTVYRIVWSAAVQGWAVASEIATSRGKQQSAVRMAKRAIATAGVLAVALSGLPSIAAAVTMPNFDPYNCDGMACATNVSDGATVTLTGQGTQIATGSSGLNNLTPAQLLASGRVTSGAQYLDPDNPASLFINTGSKSVSVVVPDPITGGTKTVAVYSNAQIIDTHASSAVENYTFSVNSEVNGGQYINTRIGNVDSTGGTLNVNIGNGGATNAAGNSIVLWAKQSSLFKADGTGSASSNVVWQSSNYVNMGSVNLAAPADAGPSSRAYNFSTYKGTFKAFDGSSHTVNNAADLQAYNSFLISGLQSGALSASQYDAQFALAYTTTSQTITWSNTPTNPNDEAYQPVGVRAVIQADGAKASGTVAAGARLDVLNATRYNNEPTGMGAIMLATKGGLVTNQGSVSVRRGGNDMGVAMQADGSGSRAVNSGVLNVGFFSGQDGQIDPVNPTGFDNYDVGLMTTGSGSSLSNTGIVNIAGPVSRGLVVGSGTTGTNAGIVNVSVSDVSDTTTYAGRMIEGVDVSGTFTNQAGGQIYLGRGAQYDMSQSQADTTSNSTPLVGIYVESNGTANNAGTITIGGKTQGSQGIYDNGSSKAVTNSGVIQVNGAASDTPTENEGMYVLNAKGANNTGTINLNGVNGVGIKAVTTGTGSASAVSSGTVNVAGDLSANGLRNYGVWADGNNSNVKLTGGAVNLSGDGAIGVHARNGGNIQVNGGTVNFVSGQKQIGFFAYGTGSSVDINSAPAGGLNASTDGSTLFRIEDGAKVNNNAAAPLIASGANSTALQVTGVGSSANLSAMDITVSGAGATALKVEGGATGQMSGAAKLTLKDGTTAVVVDNTKYDLNGNAVGSAQSSFTNDAAVNVTNAQNVTAFAVRNGATLTNTGDIHLSNGTAIDVSGAGSSVAADASGRRGSITVDDGTAGIYVHGGATLTTNDTITVNNGASGVLVGADAGKVTIGADAHITGQGNAYGNLVTNQSGAGNVLVDGATLEMQGKGAALLTQNNLDAASHGHVLVSSEVGGKGIALSNADGSQGTGSLTVGPNWQIDVTGNGSGVYANTSGDLTLAGTQLNVTGNEAATGVRIDAANAVSVAAGTSLSTADANATLIAGNPKTLTNAGTLSAASTDTKAVALDDHGHAFVNAGTGSITGQVSLGNGTNTALLQTGSMLNGTLLGGTGDDTVTVQNNAGFTTVDGGVGGNDRLIFDGAQYTYSDAGAIRDFETVQLSNNSTVTLQRALTASDSGTDSNTIAIDAGSTLAVAPASGAFVLNNPLSGAGTVSTDTQGQSFDFGAANAASTGANFTGKLALGNSTLALQGQNTTALRSATLESDAGSVTTVGDGDQKIGGLKLNGGTMIFDAIAPDQKVANSTITANTLDASGTGDIRINVPAPYVPSAPGTPNTANLLEQDDTEIGLKLVDAATTTGSGGALTLQDQNGAAISAQQNVDIAQGGSVVAKGTYDFRLTTAPGDGLYVNYGLTQLDLQQGETLSLQQAPGATGAAADMSAKITGTGNLAIDAGTGTVSLSNTTNDYTGETTAASGTLKLEADNAMGQTSVLHIADAAATDLNDRTQTIGALDGQSGSTLNVDGGTLTIAHGGTSAGTLTGEGQLNLSDGVLDVQGANGGLTASTSIASGATAHLDNAAGLGSGAIADAGTLALDGASGTLANDLSGAGAVNLANGAQVKATGDNSGFAGQFSVDAGTSLTVSEAKNLGTAAVADNGQLVVNSATDWTLGNALAGTGDLVKNGAGTLTAGDALDYTGKTDINAGTLVVGDESQPAVTLGGAGAGTVTVAQGATLAGAGTVNGQVVNAGTVSALNALPGHEAAAAGNFTLANGLVNSGTVNLAGASVGNTLTVKGDYVGQNGQVVLNTVMGDDHSATDKVVLDGGHASGDTALVIKHAGGNGAQTTQGIRVVETVNGALTDATAFRLSSTSDGYRQGAGTIAAGAYDYSLLRGGNGGTVNDWYLSSVSPVTPLQPDNGSTDNSGSTPDNTPTQDNSVTPPDVTPAPAAHPVYRPEVGAYLDNRAAAMTMQFHTLHDRQGQAPGVMGATGAAGEPVDANSWVRIQGTVGEHDIAQGLHSTDTSYLLHMGSDVARFSDGGNGSMRVGVMAQYGSVSGSTDNGTLNAKSSVSGYSGGVYGTWYGHRDMQTGPYVDTWLMYGAFNNHVTGAGLPTESYHSQNVAASLEGGYAFRIFDTPNVKEYLEPEAQVIYSNYRAKDHTEAGGTVVSGQSASGVTTRLGVRLHGDIVDEVKQTQMRPFAELNWWHGPSAQSMSFDGTVVRDALPANRGEFKIGLQGNVTKNLSVWGSVGVESNMTSYTEGRAQMGLKYGW